MAYAIKKGSDYFNIKLWTGNGTNQDIDVGWNPDLVWYRNRTDASGGVVTDSIRGDDLHLQTTNTNGEGAFANMEFITNGYNVTGNGNLDNISGKAFVGWHWRASDSTAVTNTDGTITSTVSANPTAGFSVVSYTGTGSAATVGHGLSQAPDMVVVKQRGAAGTNWAVYHKELTDASYYIWLNLTSGQAIGTNIWNSTDPTTSVFSIGTSSNTNTSAGTYIAYCFHSVEGYSKMGSYTGNGSTNGTFVYTGFRPAYVLVKNSTTAGLSWVINDTSRDTYNECNKDLITDGVSAESNPSPGRMDILSNGFKLRSSANSVNQSNANHIYMAFAETPFKYANAR